MHPRSDNLRFKRRLIWILAVAVILAYCAVETPDTSDDLAEFQNMVEIGVPTKAVLWEIIHTPEPGGVPGPTFATSLVAQIESPDELAFDSLPRTGTVWIAPGAARRWLGESFQSLLAAHLNDTIELDRMQDCRRLDARMKRTKRPVRGMICKRVGKFLVYLELWHEGQL